MTSLADVLRARGYLSPFPPLSPGAGRTGSNLARSKPLKPTASDAAGSLSGDLAREFASHADLGMFKSPCQATGKSGVRHSFSFGFGEEPPLSVAGDFVEGTSPVDETKVLSLFIKVYDVGAKHAMLCVVPSLTPEAKKLSGLYKIVTVEAADRVRLATMASETLSRMAKTD